MGIVLATQNPVDLDYKALSNAGTWFIGRLQTERDMARVLDGLQGTQAGTGARFERRQMGQILAGLGNRIFLVNNVHEDRPVLFESRWAMSYLRGPLTRDQIRQRYTARFSSLQERIRRAGQTAEREKEQAKQQKLQTAISVGVTLLDAFMGRKTIRRTTIGRATTAARGAGRILKEGQDVERAEENVQALERQLADLEAQVAQETEALRSAVDPMAEDLESLEIRPKKADISVRLLGLGWVPFWRDERGGITPAY